MTIMEQQQNLVLQLRGLRKQMCQLRDGLAKADGKQLHNLEAQVLLCLDSVKKARKMLEDLPTEDLPVEDPT